MNKKIAAILCIMGVLLITGCSKTTFKDNQIYTVNNKDSKESEIRNIELKTNGVIPFGDSGLADENILKNSIPLTISPDKKSIYLMQSTHDDGNKIIKGEDLACVELIRYDIETKQETLIDTCEFISLAKWNSKGDKMAFLSGENLHIYDTVKNKTDQLNNSNVTYFGWSPEGNKVYTEHPNLPNGSIHYADLTKTIEPYEDTENIYYKGILDSNYYYATKRDIIDDVTAKKTGKSEDIKTVITDKQKNIVKQLPEGRFRDSYGKAMLQTSLEGFGLQLIPDINKQQVKTLTKEYVYDAKFVYGGRIAYIIKDGNAEKNSFLLYIADNTGKELAKLELSSSRICLSPDGKTGYGSSADSTEVINFEKSRIDKKVSRGLAVKENEEIYAAVRGAVDAYYRSDLIGEKNESIVSKYFINSSNPEQWGYFDTITRIQDRRYLPNSDCYILHIYWNDYNENVPGVRAPMIRFSPRSDAPRASVNVRVTGRNSFGSGFGMEHELELIKQNNRWYVTGLSTFPDSKEAKELKKKVEQEVKNIQSKGSFNGVLKGKEVKIGQIQFWQMSDPHLASKIKNANYCKVYLKVTENGKEQIYRMVLDKENKKYWKVNNVTNERLSGLF